MLQWLSFLSSSFNFGVGGWKIWSLQLEQVELNARVSGLYSEVFLALRKALPVKATCKTRKLNALFMS